VILVGRQHFLHGDLLVIDIFPVPDPDAERDRRKIEFALSALQSEQVTAGIRYDMPHRSIISFDRDILHRFADKCKHTGIPSAKKPSAAGRKPV
jgi:hypothetical protein